MKQKEILGEIKNAHDKEWLYNNLKSISDNYSFTKSIDSLKKRFPLKTLIIYKLHIIIIDKY